MGHDSGSVGRVVAHLHWFTAQIILDETLISKVCEQKMKVNGPFSVTGILGLYNTDEILICKSTTTIATVLWNNPNTRKCKDASFDLAGYWLTQ